MTKTQTQFEYRDPQDLTVHPALKSAPRLALDDPRMINWRAGMKRVGEGNGHSIRITPDNKIVDGRHWWWNAKSLGWKKVRVEVVGDDEVNAVIMETLLNRRHYTKGQLAYCLAEHISDAFEEAKRRMLAALNQGSAPARNSVSSGAKTPEEYAAEIGVSVQYLRQAHQLHEKFAANSDKRTFTDPDTGKKIKDITLREYFEPRILDDEKPMGLGAALAGIGFIINAVTKGGGRPKEADRQLQLFNKLVDDEDNRWEYWRKFDDDARAEHFQAVRAKAALLDPEVAAERAEYHARLAEEFRKAAKAAKNTK